MRFFAVRVSPCKYIEIFCLLKERARTLNISTHIFFIKKVKVKVKVLLNVCVGFDTDVRVRVSIAILSIAC